MNLHWLKVRHLCILKHVVIVRSYLHDVAPVEIMPLLQYGDSIRTMNLRKNLRLKAFSHDEEILGKVYSRY